MHALFTYHTPNSTNYMLSKRGGSVAHKKLTFVAVHDAPDQVESFSRITFSEVVLWAPFHFSWAAFRLFFWLVIINGICITLSYHRNLSHRSFDLPKWLEYLFAYGGVLAFQCGGYENVSDLLRQPFYRFLQRTFGLHQIAFGLLLYFCGGMPFLAWGLGVATVVRSHTTFLVNSVCHIWGTRAWNTPDFSKNNWWVAIITFGEGWHNNHHAFEFSARHGLEWWQLDVTWYLIRFLKATGLATNVKLPTEAQKKRMARN
ncbi:unnamed protein product [Brassica oleracea var. botrytis]